MSTNKINAQIRLRSDTISNWLQNLSKVINTNELIVVKYDDGSIGLKFGSGQSYSNTNFIKFQNLCTGSLTNGTSTYNLPTSNGTLALTDNIPYSLVSVTSNMESWVFSGEGYNPNYDYSISIIYDDSGIYIGEPGWAANLYSELGGILEYTAIESEYVNQISFPGSNITATKGKVYQLSNRSINSLDGLSHSEWVWMNGESGTPYYSYESYDQCWYVDNPSWYGYTSPVYDSPDATYLYFQEEVTNSEFVTLTSITDQGDGSYYYTFEDAGGMSYNSYGYPNTWEFYDENGNYYSTDEISPETEIGTQFTGWILNYNSHECQLQTQYISSIILNVPQQIQNKSRDFVIKIDLSQFNSNNIPSIYFNGTLINSLPTFTNKLYLLEFKEISENSFRCIDIQSEDDISTLKTNVSSLQQSVQTINNTIGDLETIINGI